MALLEVKNLDVRFAVRGGDLTALRGISFSLDKGERLGLVGESGAGKSVAAFSILYHIAKPGYIAGGQILFEGKDLAAMSERELRKIRGNRIAMIFQDPMMTLNPVLTIGTQMVEAILAHRKISKKEARAIALDRLQKVQIPSPEKRLDQYPHELSGGMRQRVIIAIALLLDPEVIIADEPTTALDVTIQAEIMDLLLNLCEQENVALMLITHDLGVVSQVTQRMLVMYSGRIIEQGPTRAIIDNAQHPYTVGLINALPQMGEPGARLFQIPGSMPSLKNVPTGCPFHPRCEYATDECRQAMPDYVHAGQVDVACFEVSKRIEQEKHMQEERP
ncbi:MAG: ABC transporter ATP-binding protein [Marinobacter sp.]|uniref:ABC transporter ATP-binding protein n=1 Tax=Marinobacter sp. TaxID=50741 RepID=UPI003298AB9E